MRLIDADHFIATLDTVVEKHESVLWKKIAETMKYMIEVEAKMFPAGEIIHCKDCKNHMDERCIVANHHTADHECCTEVFGAERKKGKWISKGYGEYRCSSCRNIVDLDEEILMSIKMFNYCPVCGADMRGNNDAAD